MQEKLEDISWIKDITNFPTDSMLQYSYGFTPFDIAGLIFCIYVFLNLLILILTVLYIGKMFSWIKLSRNQYLRDLYKASAIVLTLINLAALMSDISLLLTFPIITYNPYYYLLSKLILVFLIFILDITVSCFNTCKYGHDCSNAMHALALCQIIWFVHRLATDAIISMIEFVIAPAQTLGTVTLLLSTVVCTILFVSALLKKCQTDCNRNTCSCKRDTALPAICCTFLIAVCTLGLIITITLLFIALVDNGLQSAGIGGFILSLIPPTAVFVIGLCVNRKIAVNFYHKVLTSSSTITGSSDTNEADTPTNGTINSQADETTPLNQRSVAINKEDSEDEL